MMKHHPALANGAHSHRIREDERGSISPYLCIASGLLTMVALLVMLSLGDATLHRRDASNAADSAALAAAGAWADSIESAYDDAVGAGNADDLWGGVGNSVGSYAGPSGGDVRLAQRGHGYRVLRQCDQENHHRRRGDELRRRGRRREDDRRIDRGDRPRERRLPQGRQDRIHDGRPVRRQAPR